MKYIPRNKCQLYTFYERFSV